MRPKTSPTSIATARQAFESWGFNATFKNPEEEPIGWPPIIEVRQSNEEKDDEVP